MAKFNFNQMTNGKAQLDIKKIMAELKLNQITCDKPQFNQKHRDRFQIKSNDLWQSSIQSKTLS